MPNANRWTSSKFASFIKSALRSASMKWPPIYETRKRAWLRRGIYLCAGYGCEAHEARAKDVRVDHIEPVIDPVKGFVSWDAVVERMFVEADRLQVLCTDCHKLKTTEERQLRTAIKKEAGSGR